MVSRMHLYIVLPKEKSDLLVFVFVYSAVYPQKSKSSIFQVKNNLDIYKEVDMKNKI